MKKNIKHLIDFKKVDTLLEGFNKTTGFVTAILDLEGNILTKSGWRQICTEFHRINPATSEKCTTSDTALANEMAKGKKYHFYKCLNGLIDVAVPIIIDGEHIANLFSGQFFFEEPDLAFFKKQAKKFGFDENKYLDALSKAPIVSEEKVKIAMDFLLNMTILISDLASQKAEQVELNKQISESKNKFESVFESANVGKSFTLPTGEINVNQAFCDILGYTREELQNKKWQDITPQDEISSVQKILEPLLKGEKKSVRFEKRYICKNGTFIWADVSTSLQFDEKGKPLHFITTLIDITHRKQSEEKLFKSQKLMAQAEELAALGSWEWDIKNDTWVLSDNWKRIHGAPDIKPTTDQLLPIAHPDDRSAINEAFYRTVSKGEPYDIQHRIIRQDTGEIRYVQAKGVVVFDNTGQPVALVGAVQDISERKIAEMELVLAKEKAEESEKRFNLAMNASNDGLFDWNLETNEIYYSPGWKKMLGYEDHELPNDFSIWETNTDPEDVKKSWELQQKLVDKQVDRFEMEFKMKHKDGHWVDILSRAEAIFNEEGKAIRMVGTHTDISERKRLNEALEKRILALTQPMDSSDEIGFEELFNIANIQRLQDEFSLATNVASIITDPDGAPLTKPSNFTRLCSEIIRKTEIGCANCFKSDAALGQPNPGGPTVRTCLSGGLWDAGAAIYVGNRHIANWMIGQVRNEEQSEEKIRAYAALIGADEDDAAAAFKEVPSMSHQQFEQVSKALFTLANIFSATAYQNLQQARFISERKQAEEVRLQLDVAQKTALFKQNFLANMSHEIRTPLTGVLGMIDILNQTQLSEEQQDYLNTVKTSGENLREIINQVLDYSKIEAGKVNIYPIVFEFRSLMRDSENLYKYSQKKGVQFKTDSQVQIPAYIKADRFRLSQVINNLVSNALKFTREGSVTIRSTLVSSNAQNKQVVIKTEVADTGIGIPVSLQKKLFAPFSQIDVADIRQHEGTGLGLSICKQLIELMGGEIGVTSQEGKGSTFWFTFPASVAEQQPTTEVEHTGIASKKNLHILLAEDKVVNQKVVKLMLTSLGHQVHIAENGQEALNIFQPGKFDLILMDIQMPVMDGVTATQTLKRKYHNLPPIVGLSANAFEGDREKYMSLGMDEYLTKPVKKEDFEGVIKKLIV